MIGAVGGRWGPLGAVGGRWGPLGPTRALGGHHGASWPQGNFSPPVL
jgi:hypothetical protein